MGQFEEYLTSLLGTYNPVQVGSTWAIDIPYVVRATILIVTIMFLYEMFKIVARSILKT
jgi:hypothetical protein